MIEVILVIAVVVGVIYAALRFFTWVISLPSAWRKEIAEARAERAKVALAAEMASARAAMKGRFIDEEDADMLADRLGSELRDFGLPDQFVALSDGSRLAFYDPRRMRSFSRQRLTDDRSRQAKRLIAERAERRLRRIEEDQRRAAEQLEQEELRAEAEEIERRTVPLSSVAKAKATSQSTVRMTKRWNPIKAAGYGAVVGFGFALLQYSGQSGTGQLGYFVGELLGGAFGGGFLTSLAAAFRNFIVDAR